MDRRTRRQAEVRQIPVPVAAPGEVVVDVERVGVCGTDVEFYTGEMQYLHERRKALGVTEGLIRLSVGVEDAADLLGDLEQAFKGL